MISTTNFINARGPVCYWVGKASEAGPCDGAQREYECKCQRECDQYLHGPWVSDADGGSRSSLQLYQTAGSCPSCQPRMNVPLHSWDTLELFFGRRPRNCAALPVGLRRFLVAPVPVRDLLLRAKDLFIAAIVAGIHRTEMIPLRGTLARPREVLGWDPVQPPGTLSRGYPARIKLVGADAEVTMMTFLLLVTWLAFGQPPSDYQIPFSSNEACEAARLQLIKDAERIGQSMIERASAQDRQIGGNNKTALVMAAISNAPYVSAVCVQTSAS